MFEFVNRDSVSLPILEKDVEDIESTHGFRFPQLLREYYLKHNGKQIRFIDVHIFGNIFPIWLIFPLKYGILNTEIMQRNELSGDEKAMRFFPFAYDTARNMYCIDKSNGDVYLFDGDDITPIGIDVDSLLIVMSRVCMELDLREKLKQINRTEEDAELEKVNFIPLGSIVLLKSATKRLMVVGRALNVKKDEKTYFFDYGAVLYPEGFISDRIVYFNHSDIEQVFYLGYDDDDNQIILNRMNEYLEANPQIERTTKVD